MKLKKLKKLKKVKKINKYTNYRKFLRDYYDSRRLSGKFSYQIWADELGFGAKSHLCHVIAGRKNISYDAAMNIALSMFGTISEREYFLSLVLINQIDVVAPRVYVQYKADLKRHGKSIDRAEMDAWRRKHGNDPV